MEQNTVNPIMLAVPLFKNKGIYSSSLFKWTLYPVAGILVVCMRKGIPIGVGRKGASSLRL